MKRQPARITVDLVSPALLCLLRELHPERGDIPRLVRKLLRGYLKTQGYDVGTVEPHKETLKLSNGIGLGYIQRRNKL